MKDKMETKVKKQTIKKTEPKEKKDVIKGNSKELIAVIRIDGEVKLNPQIKATLYKLRLRRKFTCILADKSNKSVRGMVETVKFNVAYGTIDNETLVKLISKRGQNIDKKSKINPENVAQELLEGKKLTELGLKPFFRLHPPIKGIKSKLHYPKGVLGNHGNNINKLIERML